MARRKPSDSAALKPATSMAMLHDLLLVEDHAQRLGQDRLQAGVEVGHRLEALAAAQVGVDGVALDGTRAG